MHLWRAIFDYPVFDIPLSDRDTWGGLLRIERLRSLPFHSEHELGRTIGTVRVLGPLGEVEMSGAHRRDVAKPYRCRGGSGLGDTESRDVSRARSVAMMFAKGRTGSFSPAGPVSTLRVMTRA